MPTVVTTGQLQARLVMTFTGAAGGFICHAWSVVRLTSTSAQSLGLQTTALGVHTPELEDFERPANRGQAVHLEGNRIEAGGRQLGQRRGLHCGLDGLGELPADKLLQGRDVAQQEPVDGLAPAGDNWGPAHDQSEPDLWMSAFWSRSISALASLPSPTRALKWVTSSGVLVPAAVRSLMLLASA
jgi:hypothetical protein